MTGEIVPGSLAGTLAMLAVCLLVHESWRWAGLVLGRNLSVDGLVFRWVQLVATALVAALVMRLVVFPAGLLAEVAPWARLLSLVVGIVVYLALGRALGLAIAVAALTLVACVAMLGA